jgi:peroxiredoxin
MSSAESMPAKIGVLAPLFEATDVDGKPVCLIDFRTKSHVVMMTGAITSPMCAFQVPAFNKLQAKFSAKGVHFLLLYTRESHAAENYSSHRTFAQKLSYARELRDLEKVELPIIVDSLDGRIHQAYGSWPNALFVIHKDGRLVFRSNAANHAELSGFLERLLAGEAAKEQGQVTHTQYSESILPIIADRATHRRVMQRAGTKAFENYWTKRPENRNRWP